MAVDMLALRIYGLSVGSGIGIAWEGFCLTMNNTEFKKDIIAPVVNEGIKKYFELYPKAILSAKRNLQEYLERKR